MFIAATDASMSNKRTGVTSLLISKVCLSLPLNARQLRVQRPKRRLRRIIRCPAGGGTHNLNTSRHHDFESDPYLCSPNQSSKTLLGVSNFPRIPPLPWPPCRSGFSCVPSTAVLSYNRFRVPGGKGLPLIIIAFWNSGTLHRVRSTEYSVHAMCNQMVVRARCHGLHSAPCNTIIYYTPCSVQYICS